MTSTLHHVFPVTIETFRNFRVQIFVVSSKNSLFYLTLTVSTKVYCTFMYSKRISVKIWQAQCLFLPHAVPPVHGARSQTKNFSLVGHFLRENEQFNELNFVDLFAFVTDMFCTTECLHGFSKPILSWSVLVFASAGILFILFCVWNRAGSWLGFANMALCSYKAWLRSVP